MKAVPKNKPINSIASTVKVRAKFRCDMRDPGSRGRVILRPVFSDDPEHENSRFWSATPSGTIEMFIDNEESLSAFEVGKEYSTLRRQINDSSIALLACVSRQYGRG